MAIVNCSYMKTAAEIAVGVFSLSSGHFCKMTVYTMILSLLLATKLWLGQNQLYNINCVKKIPLDHVSCSCVARVSSSSYFLLIKRTSNVFFNNSV